MKYLLHGSLHLYVPEDRGECIPIFHRLQEKLELQVPCYADRERELCEEYRDGAWFPWPFYLPVDRPSDGTRSLLVDVALAMSQFWTHDDPVCRWSITLPGADPQRDAEDLLALLRKHVNARLRSVREDRIFEYLRLLTQVSETWTTIP